MSTPYASGSDWRGPAVTRLLSFGKAATKYDTMRYVPICQITQNDAPSPSSNLQARQLPGRVTFERQGEIEDTSLKVNSEVPPAPLHGNHKATKDAKTSLSIQEQNAIRWYGSNLIENDAVLQSSIDGRKSLNANGVHEKRCTEMGDPPQSFFASIFGIISSIFQSFLAGQPNKLNHQVGIIFPLTLF